jgi:hypothetical protein
MRADCSSGVFMSTLMEKGVQYYSGLRRQGTSRLSSYCSRKVPTSTLMEERWVLHCSARRSKVTSRGNNISPRRSGTQVQPNTSPNEIIRFQKDRLPILSHDEGNFCSKSRCPTPNHKPLILSPCQTHCPKSAKSSGICSFGILRG